MNNSSNPLAITSSNCQHFTDSLDQLIGASSRRKLHDILSIYYIDHTLLQIFENNFHRYSFSQHIILDSVQDSTEWQFSLQKWLNVLLEVNYPYWVRVRRHERQDGVALLSWPRYEVNSYLGNHMPAIARQCHNGLPVWRSADQSQRSTLRTTIPAHRSSMSLHTDDSITWLDAAATVIVSMQRFFNYSLELSPPDNVARAATLSFGEQLLF